ncbi:MAG: ribonuclease activity regulator RraA [Alphaproteobacteria bacterium]|nr:ribonuclease activity regulator RraA [Alphaproteobacteria bacterium]
MNPDILRQLAGISTATATMQLLKRGLRNCFIRGARPFNTEHCQFAALAYTLRFIPMREDLSRVEVLADPEYPPRKAVEDIPPGMALVIDARGDLGAGVIGDILAARLQERGVAAVVSDGPVRDAAQVAAGKLPVFCAGAAAPASLNVHFGADLQRPIACGGVAVIPGDVLVGDSDGVVVIPAALAAEVARDGAEQEQLEGFLKQRVAAGHPTIGTYPPNPETLQAYNEWKNTAPHRQ